jgi:hypothetical protein
MNKENAEPGPEHRQESLCAFYGLDAKIKKEVKQ